MQGTHLFYPSLQLSPLILCAPIFSIVTFVNVIVPNSAETKHGLSV